MNHCLLWPAPIGSALPALYQQELAVAAGRRFKQALCRIPSHPCPQQLPMQKGGCTSSSALLEQCCPSTDGIGNKCWQWKCQSSMLTTQTLKGVWSLCTLFGSTFCPVYLYLIPSILWTCISEKKHGDLQSWRLGCAVAATEGIPKPFLKTSWGDLNVIYVLYVLYIYIYIKMLCMW